MKTVFYFSMELWGALFSMLAALWVSFLHNDNDKQKDSMMSLLFSLALLLFSDSIAWIFRGNMGPYSLLVLRISNFMSFLMSYVFFFVLVEYLRLKTVKVNRSGIAGKVINAIYVTFLSVSVIGVLLIIASLFTDVFYYFDANHYYHRGPYHYVIMVTGLIAMLLFFIVLISNIKNYSNRLRKFMIIGMIGPTVALIVQVFVYGFSLFNIAITITVFLFLIEYIMNLSEKEQEKQKMFNDMQMKLMLSQIKPHFIYNVLNTIYFLCKKDPSRAQRAIAAFSDYLRGNLDSLGEDDCIDVEQEIHNVENYMILEKMRFADRLHVEYDIRVKDFKVPSLSIQTLAENAVKHGVCNKKEGGTVWISIWENEHAYIVEVRDDGVGYHPEKNKDDGRSHIGIENTRGRIHNMSGGTLDVSAGTDGTGTIATMSIPKKV